MDRIKRQLRTRVLELDISERQLAEKAGISRTAVRQVLRDPSRSSVASLWAVAKQLGLELAIPEVMSSYEVKRRAALDKARRMVAMVQGSSALEMQAVEQKRKEDMVQQTADELMGGPARFLWTE